MDFSSSTVYVTRVVLKRVEVREMSWFRGTTYKAALPSLLLQVYYSGRDVDVMVCTEKV